MSFNDAAQRSGKAGAGPNGSFGGSSGSDKNFPDQLQQYQRLAIQTKDKVAEMKRRKISSQEKKELDGQLKDLREQESRLRIALDNQLKQLESATRNAETAQKRIALDKLSKDFQKIKAIVLTVLNDAGSLQVSDVGVNGGTVVRPGAEDYDTRAAEPLSVKAGRNQQQQQQLQEPQLQMLGESVDEAIALEREREIKQMNQDLLLVNEMMRDVANIVKEQGTMVQEIHDSTVDSHDKAKAGLDQVKQAAAYQPTCVMS